MVGSMTVTLVALLLGADECVRPYTRFGGAAGPTGRQLEYFSLGLYTVLLPERTFYAGANR